VKDIKELNKEQLKKVSGGEGESGKWYFRYRHITSGEYASEWVGPYDNESDYVQFASDHPITNPGEYEIEKMFLPYSSRTITTYL